MCVCTSASVCVCVHKCLCVYAYLLPCLISISSKKNRSNCNCKELPVRCKNVARKCFNAYTHKDVDREGTELALTLELDEESLIDLADNCLIYNQQWHLIFIRINLDNFKFNLCLPLAPLSKLLKFWRRPCLHALTDNHLQAYMCIILCIYTCVCGVFSFCAFPFLQKLCLKKANTQLRDQARCARALKFVELKY